MKVRNIIFITLSIIILIGAISYRPFDINEESDFFANSPDVDKNVSHQFNLNTDSELRFKAASKDTMDSSIMLTNIETDEVIFYWINEDINQMIIENISSGTYLLEIKHSEGYMNYRIKTVKK